jgi:uncharacterized damage-inducible protein DinB
MTTAELLADVLNRSVKMINDTLAELSEAEMLTRPAPGANHATWQIGHLCKAQVGLVNSIKEGAVPALPESFASKFTAETVKNDDASFFPKKDALLAEFNKINAATAAWAKNLSQAELDKPTTGRMADFAPTNGHLVAMLSNHNMMHLGQFQVLRRKLGKKILF